MGPLGGDDRGVMVWFKVLVILYGIGSASGNTDLYSRVLCGDPENPTIPADVRKWQVENIMPPVANQESLRWCYAFVAADLINHHQFLSHRAENNGLAPNAFYTPDNMVSALDLVSLHNSFRNREVLDTSMGGSPYSTLASLRENNYQTRSFSTLPIVGTHGLLHDLTAKLMEVNSQIEEELAQGTSPSEELLDQLICYSSQLGELTSTELRSLERINQKIYQFVMKKEWIATNTAFKNYKEAIETVAGPPDLAISPFLLNTYTGNDPLSFFTVLAETLHPRNAGFGRPVQIGICQNDLVQKIGACEAHSVSIVGAYWRDGKCQVKIRDSQGMEWGDSTSPGHFLVDISRFLEIVTNYKETQNQPNLFSSSWISSEISGFEGFNRSYLDNESYYLERIEHEFEEMRIVEDVKTRYHFRDNQLINGYMIPLGSEEFFTGEFINNGTALGPGTITDKDGKIIRRTR